MEPQVNDDIYADIKAAMEPLEDDTVQEEEIKPEVIEETVEEKAARERDEKGRFKAKEEKEEAEVKEEIDASKKQEVETSKIEPPLAWSAAVKAKWAELPPDIQAEISRREQDVHKMMTRNDGELSLGKELKEVINPYMPIIQAEGGTPAKAVGELLNTAYQLRTAQPQQKAALVQQIINQYGVDMSLVSEEQGDPTIAALHQEIAALKNQINPDNMKKQLHEFSESANVNAEIRAFASDPAHKYYEQVKPIMAALLGNGQAQNLKEAYDMACMAKPDIRSIIDAERKAEQDKKRKEELEAKKKAAVSISGSQGNSTAKPQTNSIEDDVRAAFSELSSSV